MDINKVYDILLKDDIELYEDELFLLIPELKYEKDFDQKSPWHSFDVWNHTLATIKACNNDKNDRLVMLLHDIGKPFSYQDDGNLRHFKNHAIVSKKISQLILDRFNIKDEDKKEILKLIELHSSKIDINDINKDNIDFYKRLLKIKTYDAKGYEKEHSTLILNNLDDIKEKIYTI